MFCQNINGAREKLDILQIVYGAFDIIFVNEHLLNEDTSTRLITSSDHRYFIYPAKSTGGRPSGGLMITVRKKYNCNLFESNDVCLAVEFSGFIAVCVYMPTNYRNDRSSQKFASACSSLSKLLERIALTRKFCVIMDDFNTDINDNTIGHSQMSNATLPQNFYCLQKNR